MKLNKATFNTAVAKSDVLYKRKIFKNLLNMREEQNTKFEKWRYLSDNIIWQKRQKLQLQC